MQSVYIAQHVCTVQDANGDSDLWDLAITEAGEAVRHPSSTSPFASKALLTCFNSDVRSSLPHPNLLLPCAPNTIPDLPCNDPPQVSLLCWVSPGYFPV